MRLLFAFLLVGVISIHTETSAQEYSLSLKDTPLRQVIRDIEKQGDYRFFFSDDVADFNTPVQIDISNATIEQLLDKLLSHYDLGYQILENNLIIITPYKVAKQDMVVTGTVIDADGEPLPGVNVMIKGTSTGTTTDLQGMFSIPVPNKKAALSFSFVGFVTREITVGNRTIIDVTLEEDNYRLSEVVVTALGIKRAEKALSYNVQEIKGVELTYIKNANFITALSGKVAGVQINASAAGPGSAARVVMRGVKSLSKNNNALYVIDGIPMYYSGFGNDTDAGYYFSQPGTDIIADMNPEDIESISLLTGPSAAALYGYEGANGVVLITTKKGRADGTSITASNNTTFSTPLVMPKFQNRYGNIAGESESWGGETSYHYNPTVFFNKGVNVSNGITVETGNEKNRIYLSMAAVNANGILPNNTYDRYNFAFRNSTSFLNDRMVFDVGANYIIQNDRNMVSQGQYFNPLPALYLFPRGENFDKIRQFEQYDGLTDVNMQFWPYGDQGLSLQNPYWIMYRMNRDTNRKRYQFSARLEYDVTDWLNISGRIRADNTDLHQTEKRYGGTLATFAGTKGFFSLGNRREQQIYGDMMVNIKKYTGNFSFNINFGASVKDFSMDSHNIMGNLDKITNWFTTENIDRILATPKDGGMRHQSQSIFANAEIGYKNMFYLTLTGRNDWDSALAFSESGDKSFFYPSAGLSAIISEMITLPQWFSYLKARLSYTSVGSAYDAYMTKERYEYDEQTNQYNTLSLYPNRNLKPELTNSFETGLNMRFFEGVTRLDVTYYKSNTLNQTFIAELSAGSAYSGVYVQSGNVQNSGVELTLELNKKWGNCAYHSYVTYSFNDNVIKKLADGIQNPVTGEIISMPYLNVATLGSSGAPEVRLLEGGSMGDLYVMCDWQRNDNGQIHIDAISLLPHMIKTEYQKIGSVLPKTYAGWKNTFSYKGIRINALISGRFGGLVVSSTQAIADRYGVSEHSAKLRETGIFIENTLISARDYLNIVAAGTGQGAHYVYSATNIRLGELSIHYSIPQKWVNNIADITIGLVGYNLAMFYCKAPFDPELTASATNIYYTGVDYFMQPSLRSVGVNIKVKF